MVYQAFQIAGTKRTRGAIPSRGGGGSGHLKKNGGHALGPFLVDLESVREGGNELRDDARDCWGRPHGTVGGAFTAHAECMKLKKYFECILLRIVLDLF